MTDIFTVLDPTCIFMQNTGRVKNRKNTVDALYIEIKGTDWLGEYHLWILHCKFIQCNFYTFYGCPTFHCNPTVPFTFNCCTKYSRINKCNTDLHFYILICMANNCKVYTFYGCPSFNCNFTVYKDLFIKNQTRTVVTLLLFWFDFLWISLY